MPTDRADLCVIPNSTRRAGRSAGRGRTARFLALALAAVFATIGDAPPARGLIFASPDTEPTEEVPPDFPYWEHVTQRRYEGPTTLYLGAGYALTARHVGMGEIPILGKMYAPVPGSKRSLMNVNGTAADAMVFALDRNADLPDLPLLPIARSPALPGEEVLVIGFGRGREKVIEYELDGRTQFGFTWTKKGGKRWGTNRIQSNSEILNQGDYTTRAIVFRFDQPLSPGATRYEAQATTGDSGGAVFVQREGVWQLVGLMVSVSGEIRVPNASSRYGDTTFAADLTYYREEIMRWTRPLCANELDDDGDGRIDFPLDPGCDSPSDRNEWDASSEGDESLRLALAATIAAGSFLLYAAWRKSRRQRGTSTPRSTSPSSAD